MPDSIQAAFKVAAATVSKTSPGDPIANSFEQFKIFADIRCSVAQAVPSSTKPLDLSEQKGSVTLVDNSPKAPELVFAKWVDNEGVVRTRNTLNNEQSQERLSGVKSYPLRIEREMRRAWHLLVNKDDIREHLLLNPCTIEALQSLVSGNFSDFLQQVLANRLVTADMLIRVSRGPIFQDWMVKQLIFDAVMKSNVDFNKKVADNAVAATAHFIANNGMIVSREDLVGHKEWKPENEAGLEKYFSEVDASATSSNIFTLFNQTILQFGTPTNIGSLTVENLIARCALAYAIILQASARAVEQLVRDTQAHAAKVSLDVSVIFAAITFGSEVVPNLYAEYVMENVEGVIQTVISNYVNKPVAAMNAVASNLNDQFSNYILKPALAGDSVPGLFPVASSSTAGSSNTKPASNATTPTTSPAISTTAKSGSGVSKGGAISTPPLTAAAKRRKLGQLFQTKYQDYIGMLDTVHTPMRKI